MDYHTSASLGGPGYIEGMNEKVYHAYYVWVMQNVTFLTEVLDRILYFTGSFLPVFHGNDVYCPTFNLEGCGRQQVKKACSRFERIIKLFALNFCLNLYKLVLHTNCWGIVIDFWASRGEILQKQTNLHVIWIHHSFNRDPLWLGDSFSLLWIFKSCCPRELHVYYGSFLGKGIFYV